MKNPLTKTQEALRGRKINDMTDGQLRQWIDACDRMEKWKHTPAKARRGWKASGARAEAQLATRNRR
jgi:hypothetical protein